MRVDREFRALREMARIVNEVTPEVVHAFTIKPVLYLSLVVAWRSLRRSLHPRVLINNLTGLGYLFSESSQARVVRGLLWPLLVVCLRQPRVQTVLMNHGDRRRLMRMGVLGRARTHLIRGTGVDTAQFVPPAAVSCSSEASSVSGRSGGSPKVLFAGRLLVSKGVLDFAEAARRLAADGVDAEFLVAGTPDSGNPEAISLDVVEAWHAEGRVAWLGHVEDMSELLSIVDMVALPSHQEGLPRVLLEGAAAGCGLVATNIDGCRELIDHGRNGLLVPAQDPEALGMAFRRMLGDAREREELTTQARRDVVEHFDVEAINDQWANLYQRLLEGY
jgi:glycosyltransferase involved in cell wall biosynthesis